MYNKTLTRGALAAAVLVSVGLNTSASAADRSPTQIENQMRKYTISRFGELTSKKRVLTCTVHNNPIMWSSLRDKTIEESMLPGGKHNFSSRKKARAVWRGLNRGLMTVC